MGTTLQELPDDCFALVRNTEDGRVERLYPLRSGLELTKAAGYFLDNEQEMYTRHTPAELTQIGEAALEKVAQFSTSLDLSRSRLLEQWAGRGFTTPTHVKAAVGKRLAAKANKIPDDVRDGLQKMAAGFETRPELCVSPDSLKMLRDVLQQFDTAYGYAASVEDRPEKTAFAVTMSDAQLTASESCCLTNGNIYAKQQLARLTPDDLIGIPQHKIAGVVTGLGKFAAVDTLRLADAVSNFNAADTEIIEEALQRRGEQPCYRKTAAASFSVAASALFEIARQAERVEN